MPKTKEPVAAEAEAETEAPKAKRDASRSLARRKKCKALRGKAAQAGYLSGTLGASAGRDQLKSLITKNNVKKMCEFIPERIAEELAYNKDEFSERLATAQEKFSTGAFEVLAPKIESIFRAVTAEALTRSFEFGQTSINAATMASVLRPYQAKTLFDTAAPPPGIIKHAQTVGALSVHEKDKEMQEAKQEDAKIMQKEVNKIFKERAAAKKARSEAYKASGRTPPGKKAKKAKTA